MPVPKPSTPKAPPPKKGRGLTFPPLVKQWTVKGEASWPGAEYTRRTRLKTHLSEDVSAEFIDEMRTTLGANFEAFESAMQPCVNRKLTRGKPPAESGHRAIQPSYTLPRANAPLDPQEENPLAGSTRSLSGHVSKTKVPEHMYTKHGPVRCMHLRASRRPSAHTEDANTAERLRASPCVLHYGRCPSTCSKTARR